MNFHGLEQYNDTVVVNYHKKFYNLNKGSLPSDLLDDRPFGGTELSSWSI